MSIVKYLIRIVVKITKAEIYFLKTESTMLWKLCCFEISDLTDRKDKFNWNKFFQGGNMILSNVETIPGRNIVKHFGLVSGSTVRAKHIGRDFMAGLKNIVGGELSGYTELLTESRRQATSRMISEAESLGANAIVNIRFATSSVAQGASEIYVYGTAVFVE